MNEGSFHIPATTIERVRGMALTEATRELLVLTMPATLALTERFPSCHVTPASVLSSLVVTIVSAHTYIMGWAPDQNSAHATALHPLSEPIRAACARVVCTMPDFPMCEGWRWSQETLDAARIEIFGPVSLLQEKEIGRALDMAEAASEALADATAQAVKEVRRAATGKSGKRPKKGGKR